jgi:hypothetical protein
VEYIIKKRNGKGGTEKEKEEERNRKKEGDAKS